MATGLVALDLADIARRRRAFTDLVLRHVDASPTQVQMRLTEEGIDVPGVARLELPTGCGKTEAALDLVQRLGRVNRQVLIVAPTVIETMQVARRLQIVATSLLLSHGVDVDDLARGGQVLVIPRTTGKPGPPSIYTLLQRIAPELFAVAHRERQVPPTGGSDVLAAGRLHRRIRRLLARLDVRAGSLADLLAAAVRRLLRDSHALVGRAASTGGHTPPDLAFGVPIPARPQWTRGPTAPWTNRILSVHGGPAYA